MKLSEAIRLGAMMKPQAFGRFYVGGGSCALGAARDAVGLGWQTISLTMRFPILRKLFDQAVACPECGHIPQWMVDAVIISHLNDDHRWTRERIADWVETIENAAVQPLVESAEEKVLTFQ